MDTLSRSTKAVPKKRSRKPTSSNKDEQQLVQELETQLEGKLVIFV